MEPFNRIKEVRDNGIAGNIQSHIVARVVSSQVLLIDILLKDITEHTRIHLVLASGLVIIEVPLIRVEECEKLFKGSIGYLDGRIALLQWMHLKETATQIGDFAEQGL